RELFGLIDLCERICNRGDFFPNDREVHFFFSKTLLPNDVTIIESDELNQVILYANYHHPISSIGIHTFHLFRQWFNRWMHSSNIISASDPEQRYDFFRRQRNYLGHLQNKLALF
ncbi:MAG: hypothetical protein LUD68_07155, partial [Rikenellaceae bacterium]|nr:hypothetical protein [Rikenellaceae bacterium]